MNQPHCVQASAGPTGYAAFEGFFESQLNHGSLPPPYLIGKIGYGADYIIKEKMKAMDLRCYFYFPT